MVLLCGLFIATFTAMIAYWLLQTRQLYIDQAMGALDGLSGSYKSYSEKAFNEIDFSLLLVQGNARQLGTVGPRLTQSVAQVLELRREHTSYVSNLIIVDARGVVVSATHAAAKTIGRNVADREYFAVHRAKGDTGFHIGPVFSTRWMNTGELRFTISRKLVGAKGEFLGVVVALVDSQLLALDYGRQIDDPTVSATLMRIDGMVLSRTPYLQDQVGQVLPSFVRYKGNPPSRASFVIKSQIDNVTRLIAQRRFDGMPMLIAVTQLEEAAMQRWQASLPLALGMWALALLTTLGLGALVLYQQRWRERAQVELRRSLEAFDDALRMAQVGSIDHDLVSDDQHWSDEMFGLLEIDKRPGDLSVAMRHERVHPDDRASVAHVCGQSKALNLPYQVTYRLRMPDGRIKWVKESCTYKYGGSSRPVREVIMMQDITVSKQAEEALIKLHAEVDARAGRPLRNPVSG
jgi:PAS domain-containing protein